MKNSSDTATSKIFERIAAALETIAGMRPKNTNWQAGDAFIWEPSAGLQPVKSVAALPLPLLLGVDLVKQQLVANTKQFAAGAAANNALLWGARGMGKSSLVKSVHRALNADLAEKPGDPARLALVEIHREDIETLPDLMRLIRTAPRRVLLFCDDLSFDAADTSYKSLKAALEGGIEGRPANALFYATSNRRHLMPRDMMENERSTAINPSEAVEEKVSLSDRFGLWLGFHSCSQDVYLGIVEAYVAHFGLAAGQAQWRSEAIAWSQARGARSGRVAWQYIQDLAGRLGQTLPH